MYVTEADLVTHYGADLIQSLTDRATPPAGAIDSGVVATAIAGAAAVIDGWLAARYRLPLDPPQPLVADIARAIAIYRLHSYKPDEKIEAEYRDALRQLQALSQGTMRLTAAGIEPPASGTSGARVTDRARPFTADTMTGLI